MKIYLFSPREETTNCAFAAIIISDHDTVKVYTDITGIFPFTSNRGIHYMIILYEYDTKAIFLEPIKTRSNTDILCAYDVLYDTFESERGSFVDKCLR